MVIMTLRSEGSSGDKKYKNPFQKIKLITGRQQNCI